MPHEHIYLLGISDLDEDHLTLGHIIAELELLCENPAPIAKVANITARLVESARDHFAREEGIMADNEYPYLEAHRQSHRKLLEFVEALADQLSTGRMVVNQELIAALWDWETGHIETSDREFGEYLKKPALTNA